jgi:hypothetical protein
MPTYKFEPGEEKLAEAYAMIAAMHANMLLLAQRSEIDAMVIGLLLSEIEEGGVALGKWKRMSAEYYPQQAVRNIGLGDEPIPQLSDELSQRIAFWTKALETKANQCDE